VEARVLMMSTNNILSPLTATHHRPVQDIVLGIYYMTREKPFAKGKTAPLPTGKKCAAPTIWEWNCMPGPGSHRGERVKTTWTGFCCRRFSRRSCFFDNQSSHEQKGFGAVESICATPSGGQGHRAAADRLKDLGTNSRHVPGCRYPSTIWSFRNESPRFSNTPSMR